jgi:hypothetical protein
MMIFTPKVGRLLAIDAFVDELQTNINHQIVDTLKERGAQEVIARIVQDCTETREDPIMRGVRLSLRVIVLKEGELREELEAAYKQGYSAAVRSNHQ